MLPFKPTHILARLTLSVLLALFSAATWGDELTVYDGTETNNSVPAYVLYFDEYSKVQCVYPAESLSAMEGFSITGISFYTTGGNIPYTSTCPVDVYLKEVDFTDFTAFEQKSQSTVVWSGYLNFVEADGGGMLTLTFDQPYEYDGGNLLIGFENTQKGGYVGISFYGKTAPGAAYTGHSSNSLDAIVDGNLKSFLPKATFIYEPDQSGVPMPQNLMVTNITANSATVSWDGVSGRYNLEYKPASSDNWITELTNTYYMSYTLTGLSENTKYDVRVQSVDPMEFTSFWKTTHFTTQEACPAPSDLAVTLTPGDGTLATLSWKENGTATAWEICINDDEENIIMVMDNAGADGTTYKLTGLTPEETYTAKVRALNGEYVSTWSETISFTPTNKYLLTVNDGTTTNAFVPIYGYYCDELSRSQFIIPADDLTSITDTEINELTFYIQNASINWGDAKFKVYLSEVDQDYFSSTTPIDWESLQQVYEGSLFVSDNKMTITFDSGFEYTGGNLLIGINQTVKGKYNTSLWYGVSTDESENAAIGGYNSTISAFHFRPKTTIDYDPFSVEAPQNLSVAGISAHEARVSWDGGTGRYNVQYKQASDVVWTIAAQGTNDTEVTLTDLQQGTEYIVRVQSIENGTVYHTSSWRTISFTTDFAVHTPTNLAVEYNGGNTVVVSWESDEQQFDLAVNQDIIESVSNPYTLTDLDYETTYIVMVRAKNNEEEGEWSDGVVFTTEQQFPIPEVAVSNITHTTADISWRETVAATSYDLRYRVPALSGYAIVKLTADDVWQDGSGYQMLLDADANAYGTIFPNEGPLSTSGNVSDATYAEFEYKIPENADGALNTSNIVIDNSVTILVPAGTYDWCITNPTPGDRMWIAAAGGNIGGRQDDYVFEAGKAYEFHVYLGGSGNDAVDVSITDLSSENVSEWTVVQNVHSPYTLENLQPATYYEVEVQAHYGSEESTSQGITFVTADDNPVPSDITVVAESDKATISWSGLGDSYNVKYRAIEQDLKYFYEDFENGIPADWTTIDNDGDEQNWFLYSVSGENDYDNNGNPYVLGYSCATSASYNNGALTPDNWLISPLLDLRGTLSVWLRGQDPSYAAEHFAIYLSTTGTDISDFTMLVEETEATDVYTEYTADLSAYAGQQGYIAIRHFNTSDMFRLNVDNFALLADHFEGTDWQTVTTNSPSIVLTDLQPMATYEYQIQSVKGEKTSAWSKVRTFTTLPDSSPTVATAITEMTTLPNDGNWYSLDGKKLNEFPKAKGVYIHNGHKVVVK